MVEAACKTGYQIICWRTSNNTWALHWLSDFFRLRIRQKIILIWWFLWQLFNLSRNGVWWAGIEMCCHVHKWCKIRPIFWFVREYFQESISRQNKRFFKLNEKWFNQNFFNLRTNLARIQLRSIGTLVVMHPIVLKPARHHPKPTC